MPRPTSITVISWMLIIGSVLQLLGVVISISDSSLFHELNQSPIPAPVQFGLMFLAVILTLVCGIAMLKGRNWGRWLYVTYRVIGILASSVIAQNNSGVDAELLNTIRIASMGTFLLVVFFLFRPIATLFFTQSAESSAEWQQDDWRNEGGEALKRESPIKSKDQIPRPVSITVISWILILTSVASFIGGLLAWYSPTILDQMAREPLPLFVQFGLIFMGVAVTLTCGIAMLKGHNWGRWGCVTWGAIRIGVAFASLPYNSEVDQEFTRAVMIAGSTPFLIILLLLFRPKATSFFTRSAALEESKAFGP